MADPRFDIKQFAFIPPPYGGVSVYVKRLIERLNKDGITTGAYYLHSNSDPDLRESVLFDEWHWLSTKRFFKLIKKYKEETAPYKIIHSHFSLEGMVFLWYLKTFCRKKIVVTVHNSMSRNYFNASKNYLNKFFLGLMANSDTTWIAVSPQAKDEMLSLPVKFRSNIYSIPAYIPIPACKENSLCPAMNSFIDKHKHLIVFYGHSFMKNAGTDIYGFMDALEMYSKLDSVIRSETGLIYCIADGDDLSNIGFIKQKAAELQISEEIYWQIGPIEDMQSLWQKTDVYIRPTSTDGDSVAVREAIDAGVQVVASDVCRRPEPAIIYQNGNCSSFTDKVKKALTIGRTEVKSVDTYYLMMLDIYKDIL